MARTRKTAAWIVCTACLIVACNKHTALPESPVAPTASLTPQGTPAPGQPDVATVNLTHGAVTAGRSVNGVVNLYSPATGSGAQLFLSSSDGAASVPATVTVPAGETTASFTVTTQEIREFRQIVITARSSTRSAIAALTIWAELPVYFDWFSEPGDVIGEGQYNRLVPGIGAFSASCDGNEVRVNFDAPDHDQFWSMVFKAPSDQPLRRGTYESVSRVAADHPNATMMISERDRSCSEVIGRFTIRDIDLQGDRVNRFRVSFEQQCLNVAAPAWFIGELRVADMPPATSTARCQQ
jgi:hypothetical protein